MCECEASDSYVIAKDTTSYYADSVEWCPFKHLHNFFVCGTYQLNEELSSSHDSQIRLGNAVLYKLGSSESGFSMSVHDCISTSGILDMKWNPSLLYGKIILALACSDGKILLKYIKEDESSIHLSHLSDHNLAVNEEKIVLSIDWSNQSENSASIITSDNKGALHYLQVGESEVRNLSSWKAHTFESWVATFGYSDQNIVYSGGDDCCFKAWDIRSLSSPIFLKKKEGRNFSGYGIIIIRSRMKHIMPHCMGVTAISKSKLNENHLVTGSYDENIFLWDIRHMKSPQSNLNIGGGIWRLRWHPKNSQYLLSAAMHGGFHVLSVINEELKLELSFNQHKSLAYGVDWSHLTTESRPCPEHNRLLSNLDKHSIKNVISSCSFYDNLLYVWGINF